MWNLTPFLLEKLMCRIDAPFGNRSLNEKQDPVERFEQALEESKIQGNVRELLIKHFANNWIDIFYNSSLLEKALSVANKLDSEPEKCIAFAFSQQANIRYRLPSIFSENSYSDSLLFKFLTDVGNMYFPASPYDFYTSGVEKHLHSYPQFVQVYYGDEYFFTKEFFNDAALNSLSDNKRLFILWHCLRFIAPPFDCLIFHSEDSTLIKGLLSLVSSSEDSSALSLEAQSIERGLEFLRTWIKYDAEMGRISLDLPTFFFDTPWEKLNRLINEDTYEGEDGKNSLANWLYNTEKELEKLLLLNFDLGSASASELEQWAKHVDYYFIQISYHLNSELDTKAQSFEELEMIELNKLCSQLSSTQLETWIRWSIQQDFEYILSNKQKFPNMPKSSRRWVCETFFDTWARLFLSKLNTLKVEDKLRVLTAATPTKIGESAKFYTTCSEWWRGLFKQLPEDGIFPKSLTPEWTITATQDKRVQNLLPYIDKSLGILRKELTEPHPTEKQIKHNEQIKQLLEELDRLSPSKSFRHRLLLMRSFSLAITDKSISLRNPLNQSTAIQWYIPISDLATRLFEKHPNIETTDSRLEALIEPYSTCTNELAKFCLSRLRLRKGEKPRDKQYTVEQIVEQSSIWRQGYLKALTELGVDLNGKVHKAMYFIKQSDPDPDVRAIATECYKSVRRKTKNSSTVTDLKRAIIAAEWWLLICQRQNLGMVINHEDALKTRRNLMRNP
ncbi:hypothetical protein AB4624_07735 [Vibrio breoganii]